MAGVTIYTAQRWQTDNILGFNRRMEVALRTDEVEVMLLERVRELLSNAAGHAPSRPDARKVRPARRSSAPRDNHCDHDSHDDQTSIALRRELEDLKRQTGVDERHPAPQPDISNLSPTDSHPDLSPTDGETPLPDLSPTEGEPSYSNLSPTDGGPSYPDLSPTEGEPSYSDLSPTDPTPVGAGFKPASNLSPADGGTPLPDLSPTPDDHELPEDADLDLSSTDQTPVGAGFKPASNLSPADGETQRGGSPQHPEPSARNLPAANAANSNAKQNANNKTPAAPAPPTNTPDTSTHFRHSRQRGNP